MTTAAEVAQALEAATSASRDAETREVELALLGMALAAREANPAAHTIALMDSDQGPWAEVDEVVDEDDEPLNEVTDALNENWWAGHLYDNKRWRAAEFEDEPVTGRELERNPWLGCRLNIDKILEGITP